ncbi:MAG: DUF5714 domain-containing protein [Sphingobacteriia bacterium]|nr:DUF5714 domain-containing protein [Sphingobacteriia bacterium]
MNSINKCPVCEDELVYTSDKSEINCFYCNKTAMTQLVCLNGHHVCNECDSKDITSLISLYCQNTSLIDPIQLATNLMNNAHFATHGSEHHYLVPAVLLTAYYNYKNQPELKREALEAALKRSSIIPYGFCAMNGTCGAGIGAGTFISIITQASPLSEKEWQMANLMTARSLERIARNGGPRCCKRDTFISLVTATEFLEELFGVTLEHTSRIRCPYFDKNAECTREDCIFFPNDLPKKKALLNKK